MAQKRQVEVRCSGCGTWFPYTRAAIHFADWDEWEPVKKKHRAVCPSCGKETEMTRQAVREKKA
jgi:rRNA maturation endonuclease Nob1